MVGGDDPEIGPVFAEPELKQRGVCTASEAFIVPGRPPFNRLSASAATGENARPAQLGDLERALRFVAGHQEIDVLAIETDQAGEKREFVIVLQQTCSALVDRIGRGAKLGFGLVWLAGPDEETGEAGVRFE